MFRREMGSKRGSLPPKEGDLTCMDYPFHTLLHVTWWICYVLIFFWYRYDIFEQKIKVLLNLIQCLLCAPTISFMNDIYFVSMTIHLHVMFNSYNSYQHINRNNNKYNGSHVLLFYTSLPTIPCKWKDFLNQWVHTCQVAGLPRRENLPFSLPSRGEIVKTPNFHPLS